MKKTHMAWLKHALQTKGRVTRNEALRRYFSRLAVEIHYLKSRGWNIEGSPLKTKNGRDYQYILVK